jgi:hypothetical protein
MSFAARCGNYAFDFLFFISYMKAIVKVKLIARGPNPAHSLKRKPLMGWLRETAYAKGSVVMDDPVFLKEISLGARKN